MYIHIVLTMSFAFDKVALQMWITFDKIIKADVPACLYSYVAVLPVHGASFSVRLCQDLFPRRNMQILWAVSVVLIYWSGCGSTTCAGMAAPDALTFRAVSSGLRTPCECVCVGGGGRSVTHPSFNIF